MKVLYSNLEDGFQTWSEENRYWLDKQTAVVVLIHDELLEKGLDNTFFDNEEEREATRQIFVLNGELKSDEIIDKDRFLLIEPPHSGDNWGWMEKFVLNEIEDSNLQEKLVNAISNSKPFRRFRAILDNSEEHLQQWYAFRDACLRKFIEEWALVEQIEIDFDKEVP
jgi:Uncharacterised protein family (UPF0158)